MNLRKLYPEVFQRLNTFVEGTTDRFIPVTLHPRCCVTGRPFVCIIMPNYGDQEINMPKNENGENRVYTVDVGVNHYLDPDLNYSSSKM